MAFVNFFSVFFLPQKYHFPSKVVTNPNDSIMNRFTEELLCWPLQLFFPSKFVVLDFLVYLINCFNNSNQHKCDSGEEGVLFLRWALLLLFLVTMRQIVLSLLCKKTVGKTKKLFCYSCSQKLLCFPFCNSIAATLPYPSLSQPLLVQILLKKPYKPAFKIFSTICYKLIITVYESNQVYFLNKRCVNKTNVPVLTSITIDMPADGECLIYCYFFRATSFFKKGLYCCVLSILCFHSINVPFVSEALQLN